MMIMVISEREQPYLELCGGARLFADEVAVLALPESQVPQNVADTVYRFDVPDNHMSEDAYLSLCELINEKKPAAIFADSTRRIQLLLGRVAARLHNTVISNVIEMPSEKEATTMFYGGLADRKFKLSEHDGSSNEVSGLGMYYIRPATFLDVEPRGANREETVDFIEPDYSVKKLSSGPRVKGDVDLPSAKRIISIGRGVKKEEDLAMVRELCELLDAEMGCSRSIYESEAWLPKEALVGISGSTVTPDVYLAVGISGQAQHMVACSGSNTVMCINNDPYAMIFDQADYGCKGDLYTVIPRMIEYFKEHPLA